MTFSEAKQYERQLVLFETDALAIDHIPKSGTATLLEVSRHEVTLEIRGEGVKVIPLTRILRVSQLVDNTEPN